MSFFTALADAYGGYGQGKQQRFQDTLQQQQQQTQQQQADIVSQQWKAQQRAILQSQNIDPDTNQPYVLPKNLTEVVPNNHGRAATPEEQIAHLTALAQYYREHGQPDTATDKMNLAYGIQTGENVAARLANTDYWKTQMTPEQQYQMQLNNEYGAPGMRRPWFYGAEQDQYGRYYFPYMNQGMSNPALVTEGKIVGQVKGQAAEEQAKYKSDLAAAIKIPLDPISHLPINPKTSQYYTAKLNQSEQETLAGVQGDIAQAQDPKAVAALVNEWAVSPNATFNSLVKEFGKFRTDQLNYGQRQTHYTHGLETQQQQQQQQMQQGGYGGGGGSYVPQDPHYPPP